MYFSRHCNYAEMKYHSHESEVLAIVQPLMERFRIYLIGIPFEVITDCAAVTTTRLQKPLLPRIARWWVRLHEYDFELRHRAGEKLPHADALRRASNEPPDRGAAEFNLVLRVDISEPDWLLTKTLNYLPSSRF